jgi:phosphate starvation-inducible protein PhoH and related proteins
MAKTNGRKNGSNGNSNNGTIDLLPNEQYKIPRDYSGNYGKRVRIKCKNEEQKEFIKLIDENEIILCNGPAGCGKTYLSILKSIEYLQQNNNGYNKIFIITPNVEISKSLGFLPGTLSDKISVYMNSIFRLFDKVITEKTRKLLVEENIIETLGLSYIRGENFDNCILIVDESQNVTKKEMLTILTRIGSNCKMILSGDIIQIDKLNSKQESGLYYAMEKLKDIEGIGLFTFSNDSIVRNGIISKILEKY